MIEINYIVEEYVYNSYYGEQGKFTDINKAINRIAELNYMKSIDNNMKDNAYEIRVQFDVDKVEIDQLVKLRIDKMYNFIVNVYVFNNAFYIEYKDGNVISINKANGMLLFMDLEATIIKSGGKLDKFYPSDYTDKKYLEKNQDVFDSIQCFLNNNESKL